jgi:PAS domain-containing protein
MQQQIHTYGSASPDEIANSLTLAARRGGSELAASIEALPVPVYITDADGWVAAFNSACIDFAGRTPVAGEDRWCVTWRLYTLDGVPLPHDRCPMAVAVKEKRAVRDVVALAERPDGTRVMFVPHPTPLLDDNGIMIGAVNILIDVTDERQAASLRAQALRCRRLAQSITDKRTVTTLLGMAREYDDKARTLKATERA